MIVYAVCANVMPTAAAAVSQGTVITNSVTDQPQTGDANNMIFLPVVGR
jgi:hypothetical protein